MQSNILLAIGNRDAEAAFSEKLEKAKDKIEKTTTEKTPITIYNIIGCVIEQNSIIDFIKNQPVNVLIYREGIKGDIDDFNFILNLRQIDPKLRIIFLANDYKPGDVNLAKLVSFQVFDILTGNELKLDEIVDLTIHPRTWKDASKYLPNYVVKNGIFSSNELETSKTQTVDNNKGELKVVETTSELELVDQQKITKNKIQDNEIKKDNNKKHFSLKELIVKKNKDKDDKDDKEKTKNTKETQKNENNHSNKSNVLEKQEKQEKQLLKFFNSPKENTDISNEDNKKYKEMQDNLEKMKEKAKKAEEEAKNERKEKEKIAKEKENIEKELLNLDKNRSINSKQKIILFYGAVPGVGTSTTALNTATYLAMKKNKVIFIEFNEIMPTLSYLLNVDEFEYGLEKALIGIETTNYGDIDKSILTKEKILNMKTETYNRQQKLPDNLSYMFFSNNYTRNGHLTDNISNSLKDLLLFLLYKKRYDYIVLDLYSHNNYNILETSTLVSTINVFVMTQDVFTIGKTINTFYDLKNSGLDFNCLNEKESNINEDNYKNILIINKYKDDCMFKYTDVKKWMKSENIICIPENYIDVLNSIFCGLPSILISKNKDFISSIKFLSNIFIKT